MRMSCGLTEFSKEDSGTFRRRIAAHARQAVQLEGARAPLPEDAEVAATNRLRPVAWRRLALQRATALPAAGVRSAQS